MAHDSFGFHLKSVMMRNALNVFSTAVPSRREFGIQIEELEKLVKKFDKKFTLKAVLSTPQETYAKKKASDLHRLTLQSKRVDDLFARMLEEILQQANPHEIPVKRKSFKMRARQFVARYNRLIQNDVKKLRAEAKQNALKSFSVSELSGLSEPGKKYVKGKANPEEQK